MDFQGGGGRTCSRKADQPSETRLHAMCAPSPRPIAPC
jgi:hypothetical protein